MSSGSQSSSAVADSLLPSSVLPGTKVNICWEILFLFYFSNPLGNRKTWYKNQQTPKTHVTGRVVAERRVGDEVKLLLDEVEDKMEKQLLCLVGGFFLIISCTVMTSGYQLTLLFIVCFKFKLACMISDNGCKN